MATAKNREPGVGVKGGKQREKTSPPVFTVADQAEDLHSRYSRYVEELDRFLAEAAPARRSRKRDTAKDAAVAEKN